MSAATALVVLGAVGLTLWRGGDKTGETGFPSVAQAFPSLPPAATPSPGEQYRTRRAEERRQEQTALQALAATEDAHDDLRRLAESMILENAKNNEIELAVEAALAAWGDGEAVCAVREGAVNVFLSRELREAQAALLVEIAAEASGLPRENIRLSGF